MFFDSLSHQSWRRSVPAVWSHGPLRMALGLLLFVAATGQPASAELITVSFQAPVNGGLIAHEAIRVSGDTFTNSVDYNSKPVLAPFRAANGVGGRYSVHPDAAAVNLDFSYMALDGAGAFEFNRTGTTSFNGVSVPIGTATLSPAGTRLPLAAHVGQLSGTLVLPNGVTLAAGTTIYSDLAGFRADYSDAASYWYDSATQIEHRTYTGGTWAFFYQDPESAGTFVTLAEYRDVIFDWEINFRAGSLTNSWSGTPVATNGLILPGSVSGYGLTTPINTTALLSNELTTPYTGFYGTFRDAFSFSFDTDQAELVSAVPEPSALVLISMGAMTAVWYRRHRHKRPDGRV